MGINQLSPAEIEANKDLTDLKPELDFVQRNLCIYNASIENLLRWAKPIDIKTTDESEENCRQMPPKFAQDILSALPLRSLSRLEEINYNWGAKVFIPSFNDEGFLKGCEKSLPLDKFPLDEHPSRILIGNGTDKTIYVSAVPPTVSENNTAIRAYQTHVLVHELFHTVERRFRDVENAEGMKFVGPEGASDFADWKRRFLESLWNGGDVQVVSNYASNYSNKIKPDMDIGDIALAEQMCECFVGFNLGILPNNHGHTSFEEAHPDLWYLMQELSLAKFDMPPKSNY